jgi:hypothetical protein
MIYFEIELKLGFAWLCLALFGFAWLSLALLGFAWLRLALTWGYRHRTPRTQNKYGIEIPNKSETMPISCYNFWQSSYGLVSWEAPNRIG